MLTPYVSALVFALMSRNKGKFSFPADYLIQQPCGSMLRLPCGVSVNVHRGTYIGVSEKLLHIFGRCPVVAHTAAHRKILLVKVNILSSQTADLANAKPRVVSNLNGQQCGIVFLFQKFFQLQILLMAECRRGSCITVLVREQVIILFLAPPYYILHRIKGNQPLREYRKAERPLQDSRE